MVLYLYKGSKVEQYIIVSFPNNNKHFVCKPTEEDIVVYLNDTPLQATCVSICDSYQEAESVVSNLS